MLEYYATIKSNMEQVFLMRLENAYDKCLERKSDTKNTHSIHVGALTHLLYFCLSFCLLAYQVQKIPSAT